VARPPGDHGVDVCVLRRRKLGDEVVVEVLQVQASTAAGEIGSGTFGYTTIGQQVGMAQRMESVASPGGVMLSASTDD
jgi:adenylate cyclase